MNSFAFISIATRRVAAFAPKLAVATCRTKGYLARGLANYRAASRSVSFCFLSFFRHHENRLEVNFC